MSFDTLQYIVTPALGVFVVLFVGVAPLMQKAMADRMHKLIADSLQNMPDATKEQLTSDVLKRVAGSMPSPFSAFGEARVMLFATSLLFFAMFFSQALSSVACRLLDPTAGEHLVYVFTWVFGGLYIAVAVFFMMYEKMWQLLFSHVTLGGLNGPSAGS